MNLTFDQAFDRLIGSLRRFAHSRLHSGDFSDVRLGHAEKIGYFNLCESFGRPEYANRVHRIIAKPCQVAFLSMLLVQIYQACMTVILGITGPLKILGAVVLFVSIKVVNCSRAFWLWTDKRLSNKGVNTSPFSARKAYGWISLLRRNLQKHFIGNSLSSVFVRDFSCQRLDAAKRRNEIVSVKSDDWKPYFSIHCINSFCVYKSHGQ